MTDRLIWLRSYLGKAEIGTKVADLGCGNGAFSIELARMNYSVTGFSWDTAAVEKANSRVPEKLKSSVRFIPFDLRDLHNFEQHSFDILVCLETIEHVLNDFKLISDMANILKSGGILFLTTPYKFFNAITADELGPYEEIEQGGHVRRGYTKAMLWELCAKANLQVEAIDFCSGFFSQKISKLQRIFTRILGERISWVVILPLRPIAPILDPIVRKFFGYTDYSICLVAQKKRY